jgi:hypothetical protein
MLGFSVPRTMASRFYHRSDLKTGERLPGGRNTDAEAQVILQVILPARAGTPCFYKIVRKRLKAVELIFALWERANKECASH